MFYEYLSRAEFWVVILFAVSCCCSQAKVKEDPTTLGRRYQMECIEETRVDATIILKLRHDDWRIPKDKLQLVKDWALCVLIKSGLMTKEGVYKIDVALDKLPFAERDNAERVIDSCLTAKAVPAPDIAFDFIKCYQKSKANYTFASIF